MFTQVDNNCSHFYLLPPTESFPAGHRLVPGANSVPSAYLKELETFKVPRYVGGNRAGEQGLFESLSVPSKTSGGKAQVAIIGETTEDAPEGPEAPHSLDDYGDEIALKLVEVTNDKAALKRWATDKRLAVARAAKEKSR